MGAGMLVHGERHQVEAVFGKVEILLDRNAGRAEIGRKIGVISMGQVLDLAMAKRQGRGRAERGQRRGRPRSGSRGEKAAPRQHPVLDRVDDADVTHGVLLSGFG
jgi:hypothetical protein